VACLLLPPLGLTADSQFGFYADLGLTALCLIVGTVLIGVRLWEHDITYAMLKSGPYGWLLIALLVMVGLGLFAVFRSLGDRVSLASFLSLFLGSGRPGRQATAASPPNKDGPQPARPGWVSLALVFGVVALNVVGLWIIYQLTPNG